VLRDLSRRHGGLGFCEAVIHAQGIPEFTADAEPFAERLELNTREVEQIAGDPTVVGLVPIIAVRLIGAVAADSAGKVEPTDTVQRFVRLIQPVAASRGPDELPSVASWGLIATGITSCRDLSGAGVVVAVIDSGIADLEHPAFRGMAIDASQNFTAEVGDPLGHGAHCVGTIFGQDVDGMRIGVARGIERALIVKIFDQHGIASLDTVLEAVQWSHKEGSHIISMSLALDIAGAIRKSENDGMLRDEAVSFWFGYQRDYLRFFECMASIYRSTRVTRHGSVLVAAAGNESCRPRLAVMCGLPAQAEGVIAVGAVRSEGPPDNSLNVAEFSNRGPDVCAPGVGIVSAGPNKGLASASRSSFLIHCQRTERSFNAAPHLQASVGVYLNCQVRARQVLRRNCFGVVGPLCGRAHNETKTVVSGGPAEALTPSEV
jgi:subtilisin family serine protease